MAKEQLASLQPYLPVTNHHHDSRNSRRTRRVKRFLKNLLQSVALLALFLGIKAVWNGDLYGSPGPKFGHGHGRDHLHGLGHEHGHGHGGFHHGLSVSEREELFLCVIYSTCHVCNTALTHHLVPCQIPRVPLQHLVHMPPILTLLALKKTTLTQKRSSSFSSQASISLFPPLSPYIPPEAQNLAIQLLDLQTLIVRASHLRGLMSTIRYSILHLTGV